MRLSQPAAQQHDGAELCYGNPKSACPSRSAPSDHPLGSSRRRRYVFFSAAAVRSCGCAGSSKRSSTPSRSGLSLEVFKAGPFEIGELAKLDYVAPDNAAVAAQLPQPKAFPSGLQAPGRQSETIYTASVSAFSLPTPSRLELGQHFDIFIFSTAF